MSHQTAPALAYDVVSQNGTVTSFGRAANFGGTEHIKLRAPIVGMATTPDGRGYWLVGQNGSVYNLGDARFFGSPGRKPLPPPAHHVIAIVPTDNGRGYWLCDASGVVTAYGDAPKLPSLAPRWTGLPIVGFAVLPNELGGWVVNSAGNVFRLGRSKLHGNLMARHLASPVVSMARSTDGGGYWLIDAKGDVTAFGDAGRAASAPSTLSAPVADMTAAPSRLGYWAVSASGDVIPGGVPSLGSVSEAAGAAPIVGIAAAAPVAPAPPPPASTLAYDLVSQSGAVTSFGQAANFGGTENMTLRAPIVGMATTPDGRGYWLVGQNGSVYNLGDAHFFGSPGNGPLPPPAHDVIAIVPTNDGQGYWLCDASGVVTAYGDAPKLPSLAPGLAGTPIVGFAVLHNETGAWVVNAAGDVFQLGQADLYGSLQSRTLAYPIVSMAAPANGGGYWLVDSKGNVTAFGDAAPPTKLPPTLSTPVVDMTAAPSGLGYWAVAAGGYVIPGGVPSRGGASGLSGSSQIAGIATALPVSSTDQAPYPAGSIGYDVNWPQCSQTGAGTTGQMPGPPKYVSGTSAYSVAIVGVDGWAVGAYNSCLAAETAWAQHATVPGTSVPPAYQLYMFLNSPSSTSTIDKTGPAGTCSSVGATARASCLAYNYGYNAALDAVAYASSQGAQAPTWWLDIENDACASSEWNNAGNGAWWSCNRSLNDQTIQGAIDGLRHSRVTVGIYSTSLQWGIITGHYVPTGAQVPLWIAGAPWTAPPYPASDGYVGPSALQPWCNGNYDFAGGVPELLQETPGGNNYPYDPDYAC
ncbi:MAG: hypothetical protein ACYCSF_01775 [Acidimicrobiales bacterium]